MNEERDWARLAERGTAGAVRFISWVYRVLGRRFCAALIYPTVVWFYVRERAWQGASRRYLEDVWSHPEGKRALGRRPGALTPLRHFREFAGQFLDRMVLWGGGIDHFHIEHSGSRHLFELARRKRGGMLLGAHLGSFDMARTLAKEYGLVLNVVMFTENSERVTRLFEELDPESRVQVLAIHPDSMQTAFEIKACIDRGELVGMLADRVPPGSRERPVVVDFLGRPSEFPASPFRLACLLGCPTFVSLCVRTGAERYRASVEQLWEGGALPRPEREKQARELAQAYVGHLERSCLRHPHQWFNFYDIGEGSAA